MPWRLTVSFSHSANQQINKSAVIIDTFINRLALVLFA